jgi:hypothetical protein
MNNLQTNNRRMVRKTGSTATETGESRIGILLVALREAKNHSTRVVLNAFNPIGAPRQDERVRHYRCYGGTRRNMSGRGGETNAR